MSTTIQKKLIRSSMRVVVISFLTVIALIISLHIVSSQRNLTLITTQNRASLEAKGRILVQNNSLALSGMVADNAFLSVQELVSRTVSEDPDVVYGIFMDNQNKTWIHDGETQEGAYYSNPPQILTDTITLWAAKQTGPSWKDITNHSVLWIEFCSPVLVDGETAGFIRYGISTKALAEAIRLSKQSHLQSLIFSLSLIIVLAIAVLWFSYFVIQKQSVRLSKPIIQLDQEAKVIAQGNYSQPVHIESDDEIGDLAQSFEDMRIQIQRYTDQLEEIIAEKMRQVRDILDHIDQGL
jgi:HAMP domain-containing protein